MIRLPPVDRGLIPATVALHTMATIICITEAPPTCAEISGTVGIKVGNTTPFALENHDIRPPVNPISGAAVVEFIKDARISESNSIPPIVWVMFISTLTPAIRINTFHGIILIAFFSSAVLRRIRTSDKVKQISPTS